MKVLYYECFAGISGDMNLGAMIDLGVDPDHLRKELSGLPVHGYELKVEKDSRRGILGTRVDVLINRDSDTDPEHRHSSHREIIKLIGESNLPEKVKNTSLKIFKILAEAEARVHGTSADDIHFHEVGAVDSIVDIVGAAICMHWFEPDAVWCSPLQLGGGMAECVHGSYPVPAPATMEILRNIPVRTGKVDFEATTPTGAAIMAACASHFGEEFSFTILGTGYGIGKKDGRIPNVVRVSLCETHEPEPGDTRTIPSAIIECNLDDMNPEYYGYVMDALFQAGAKDVYLTPVIMKKSRPAMTISVLCDTENEAALGEILFRETSTLGLRKYRVEKTMLERRTEVVETRYGKIRIKSAWYRGSCIRKKAEYEDCAAIARQHRIPLSQVYREVDRQTGNQNEEPGNGRQV